MSTWKDFLVNASSDAETQFDQFYVPDCLVNAFTKRGTQTVIQIR